MDISLRDSVLYGNAIVILLLILIYTDTHAQNTISNNSKIIGELKAELANKTDNNKTDIYIKLAEIVSAGSPETAKGYLYRARLVANKKQLPEVNLALSEIYFRQQNLDSIFYLLEEAIRISEATSSENYQLKQSLYYKYADALYYDSKYKLSDLYYRKTEEISLQNNDSITFAGILIDRSYIYESWGKRDSALMLLEKAINISKKTNYTKGMARASLAIGNLYHGLDNNLKALEYYKKALIAAKKINNIKGIGIITSNIGMAHLELGNNNEAVKYLEQSLEMLKQSESYIQVANTYDDLAIIYSKKGENKKTINYLNRALQLQKKYGDIQEIAIGYNVYAECLSRMGRHNESNRYLDSCLTIATDIEFKLMQQKSYKLYAENYKKLRMYDMAYINLDKSNQVKDSILTEKFQKQLAEFDVKYESIRKQQQIEKLQHQKKLQKANYRTLLISSISLIFIILLAGYFILNKRKKTREIAELKLEKSQIEAKQLAQQLELKNKQLTTHAINIMQRNKLLSSYSNSIDEIIKSTDGRTRTNLNSLKREIVKSIHSEKDWNIFKTYFEQVNENFINNLKKRGPNLTATEIRLATLLKLKMTNKEIASIFNITHQSVKNALYRLKTKLNLPESENLRSFILNI